MSEFEDRRSLSGEKPEIPLPPDLDNGGQEKVRPIGKRPTLPGLDELFQQRPLPILTPLELAEILQRPTPLSEEGEGASTAEVIFYIYDRIAGIENALLGLLDQR